MNPELLKFLSAIVCIPTERHTLLKFKHSLTDPSNRLSSWNASSISNCCLWHGVVCSNFTAHVLQLHLNTSPPNTYDYTFDDGYSIDWEAYHKAYEAYNRTRFGGEINPCLVDLKYLNYLDLSGNDFGSVPIPSFLGRMSSLTHLNLSYAGFMGNIPSQIGNLSNLLQLDLSYAANGTIPSQIANLSNLIYLQLRGNSLVAENLDWLSSLSKLQYLDLSNNELLGRDMPIPSFIGTMTSLSHLDLYFTGFMGDIPYQIGNLSNLMYLDLSFAANGIIPSQIGNLSNLLHLDLSYAAVGTIPSQIGNLFNLVYLQLRGNPLFAENLDWLSSLSKLQYLDLSDNYLLGGGMPIPSFIGTMTSLSHLDLSIAGFMGQIPYQIGNLSNLVYLDLSYAANGTIPSQIGNLFNLLYLQLRGNSLFAENLDWLSSLSKHSLTYLDLSKNHFSGNPFESLRSLSSLSDLYIDDNHFQGVVKEDDLANLTSLYYFSASGNNFTLKVGPNWLPTFQLTLLYMSSWQLGPNFPSWIRSQKELEYLEMSNTGILDSIPTWFWEAFSHAYYLNLSHNHIHGELAITLSIGTVDLSTNNLCGKLPYLSNDVYQLDISGNSLSESMGDFLCKQQGKPMQVEFLNLASNNLSGEIPDCWMIWPFLVAVNLQSNHFVGNLPPSMGSLAELQFLHIRNNSFSGIFPTIFMKTNELISLDLGENNFSGSIPTWIGERLLYVRILRLRSNGFLGHIPNKICEMSHLQVLDLAQNNLSGNIPSCFNNLSAMIQTNISTSPLIYSLAPNTTGYMYTSGVIVDSVLLWLKGRGDEYKNFLGLVTSIDLSNNKLLGELPREITNLNGLNFLNLSHNQLVGHIPQGIGHMVSLQSIDFSRNQLSGEIPPTISNLSFLSMLDLSHNHLKGKIPSGTQLQTFDASNFIGNNLCGLPLLVNCSSNGKIDSYDHDGKGNDMHEVNWFFVSMAFGFVVGFWIVIGPLLICRSWRYAYFHFLDDVWFKLQSFF